MSFHPRSTSILAQVRFLAYHRIKPHAPPLVRTPANSFEFQPCGRTSQVGYLMLSLRHTLCIAYVEYPSFRAWTRSEERRVGKECRSLWSQDHRKKDSCDVRNP